MAPKIISMKSEAIWTKDCQTQKWNNILPKNFKDSDNCHSFLKSNIESVGKNADILWQLSGKEYLGDEETLILRNIEETIFEPVQGKLSLVPIDTNDEGKCFSDIITQRYSIKFYQRYSKKRLTLKCTIKTKVYNICMPSVCYNPKTW